MSTTKQRQSSVLSQNDIRTLIFKIWSNTQVLVEFDPAPPTGRFLSCQHTRSGKVVQVRR